MAPIGQQISALLLAGLALSVPHLASGRRHIHSAASSADIRADEGPCDGIEKAEPRDSDPTQCKCSSRWHEVYCYDDAEPVAERKFEASVVLAACPSPYCAQHADPERDRPATTETPPTTEAPTTTVEETTTEAPTTTTVNPDMLIDAAQVIENSGGRFKCCEQSGAAEPPKVQDITVDDLPRARTMCMDDTGCGCMFGDKWHSYTDQKSSGKCRVTLRYLSSTTGQSYESILSSF